jgi:hypothetical protein
MVGAKTALTILAVILIAAATIWMAFSSAAIGLPVGVAAMGPILLVLTLVVHWMGRRK